MLPSSYPHSQLLHPRLPSSYLRGQLLNPCLRSANHTVRYPKLPSSSLRGQLLDPSFRPATHTVSYYILSFRLAPSRSASRPQLSSAQLPTQYNTVQCSTEGVFLDWIFHVPNRESLKILVALPIARKSSRFPGKILRYRNYLFMQ
jgi:hypothetical protein